MMSFGDGLDCFACGVSPDHYVAAVVSSDYHIVSGIRMHRYHTSSMSNKGRVQRTLSLKIPNSSSLVGRNGHQAVALKMDTVNYAGVAILKMARMR